MIRQKHWLLYSGSLTCPTFSRPDSFADAMASSSFGLELSGFYSGSSDIQNIRQKCHEFPKTDACLAAQFFKMVDRH